MNMFSDMYTDLSHGFQLEQTNYVEILVQKFNQDLLDLKANFEVVQQFNSNTKRIFDTLGCKVEKLDLDHCIRLLKIDYWNSVFLRSNVSQLLDSNTKSEWCQKLMFNRENKNDLPDFNIDNIKSTLESWFLDREKLFADRVDHVFRSLSKSHVTNQPEGFSKKLIFSNALCLYSDELNIDYKARDILHDLACCIATLLNHPLPNPIENIATNYLQSGIKYSFYGDYFQLQVFKSKTMHVWVHPSIAIELNTWLAKKYPNAIPSNFRTQTAKIKEFTYNHDPLTSFDQVFIRNVYNGYGHTHNQDQGCKERFAKFIGMSIEELNSKISRQNNPFIEVCKSLLRMGYPNVKDHQYYATPETIVEAVKDYLGALTENNQINVLEPSAGSGRLARMFQSNNLDCVEVSPYFVEVLKAHGINNVIESDFLKFKTDKRYDLIVMNPPYANKRLELHLAHALTLMADGAEIILIAPTGKKNTIEGVAQGKLVNVVKSFENEFDDTQIHTSIYSIS